MKRAEKILHWEKKWKDLAAVGVIEPKELLGAFVIEEMIRDKKFGRIVLRKMEPWRKKLRA